MLAICNQEIARSRPAVVSVFSRFTFNFNFSNSTSFELVLHSCVAYMYVCVCDFMQADVLCVLVSGMDIYKPPLLPSDGINVNMYKFLNLDTDDECTVLSAVNTALCAHGSLSGERKAQT